jgi:hypothetical protein
MSVTLSTADAPFFSFLGKSKFGFFSNDSVVLGASHTQTARKEAKASAQNDGDRGVHLNFKEFPMGERMFTVSENYNSNTRSALNENIVLTQSAANRLTCKDCYVYAGETLHAIFIMARQHCFEF